MAKFDFLKSKAVLTASVMACALMLPSGAYAQLSQQTGVADPSRVGEQITEQRLIPQAGPKISVKPVGLKNAPAGAENIKFNFGGLKINGVSVYTEDELYALYKDQIGTEISLADLYAIANQITLKYRNDGYILTQADVPPQTIEGGIVQLRVVEGFVNEIVIQGGEENPSALETMKNYSNQISDGGPLNISEMERQLLLINDLPGVDARTIISASKTTPGAADLLIIIERDPFEASVGIDNHGSRFLGPVQLSGASVFNSMLGLNERITAQVVAAPDAGLELAFGALGYEQPIGRYGTILSLGGSITDTDPGYTLRAFDVEGLSKNLYVGVEHPVIRSRNTNVYGRLFFDWRNVDSKNNIELTRKDRIRALRAGLKADFLDRLLGVAVNSFDLQLSQGIDVFGASDEGDANLTRALGDPTFTKANLRVERLQRVTSSVNILLSGRAQLANKPLLSSEEFGLGGYGTVRGFDPSEVVGDDGIAGKVELQWNTPRPEVQLFGFLDSGTVWDQDPTAAANKRNSLTSTGIGVRLDLPMDVSAEFVAAQPLHRDIQTQGEHDPQFFFSLNKDF